MRTAVLGTLAVVLLMACGGGDDGVSSPTTTTLASEGPDLCALLADVDPSQLISGDSRDPAAVQRTMGNLVEVVRRAHGLAPAEIEADLALVRAGLESLDTALSGVAYDVDALAASGRGAVVAEALADPAFAAAGERLGAYRRDGCGL